MNDVEERLRGALRDALGEPHVPAGLVGAAARQAGRIRRRRVATRGLAGAAAMAGGAVLAANPPAAGSRDRVAPLASVTATAPARDEVVSVVVEQSGCREGRAADASCVRTELQVGWPGASPTEGVLERNTLVDTKAERYDVPADVVVRLSDGRELTAEMEPAGERRWTAQVRVPAGASVVRVAVRNAAGEAFAEFLDSPG